jgi:hypothetical protein
VRTDPHTKQTRDYAFSFACFQQVCSFPVSI